MVFHLQFVLLKGLNDIVLENGNNNIFFRYSACCSCSSVAVFLCKNLVKALIVFVDCMQTTRADDVSALFTWYWEARTHKHTPTHTHRTQMSYWDQLHSQIFTLILTQAASFILSPSPRPPKHTETPTDTPSFRGLLYLPQSCRAPCFLHWIRKCLNCARRRVCLVSDGK